MPRWAAAHGAAYLVLIQLVAISADSYSVNFWASPSNTYTYFAMTMTVPRPPPQKPNAARGTVLFVWPGLQPGGGNVANYLPIDNGVLQPVLTWGISCAPNIPASILADPSKSWWISAQYVNTEGKAPGYTGCKGGNVMLVKPGDKLRIVFELKRSRWVQTITGPSGSVSYTIDMRGQAQTWAELVFEPYGAFTFPVVTYSDIVLRTRDSDAKLCASYDVANSPPKITVRCDRAVISSDRKTCSIKTCVMGESSSAGTGPGPLCSAASVGGAGVAWTVLNQRKAAIKVTWCNYNASPVQYAVVPPGASWGVSTFVNNVWVIIDANSGAKICTYAVTGSKPLQVGPSGCIV